MVSKQSGEQLYECDQCGLGLSERQTRRIANMEGALSELAELLIEKSDRVSESDYDRRSVYVAKANSGEVKIGKSKNPKTVVESTGQNRNRY